MNSSNRFLPPRECEFPYTISDVNGIIAQQLEAGNTLVWVEGEISSWHPSSSRHCYFRLKDASSQIPAVMWKSTAEQLTWKPTEGMSVMAVASIRVYQKGGYYQLDVHRMQPVGLGDHFVAFQKLKNKLEKEGLFDPSFKKLLPPSIRRLGVITAKTGAALYDIVRVIAKRAPQTNIVLFSVAVQGEKAAPQIAAAIAAANIQPNIDCLIVGRGGGSAEDLCAFNEEIVARAIAASVIPVISAVGHEVDFTIADFCADIRAATPSAAAEVAVGDIDDTRRRIQDAYDRFRTAATRKMVTAAQTFNRTKRQYALRKPLYHYHEHLQQTDEMRTRALRSIHLLMQHRLQQFQVTAEHLAAVSPLAVLGRGYSIVSSSSDTVIRSSEQLAPGDKVTMRFQKGSATGSIGAIFKDAPER